ncbi:hypothetical protein Vretifemale_4681, partial [Volvox reticuliferus]
KAATLAMIYAFFNVGGVLGLIVAPHLAGRSSGWPAAFITAAAGGVMWAALGSAAVARAGTRPPLPPKRRNGQLPPPQSPSQQPHLLDASTPPGQREEQHLVKAEKKRDEDVSTSARSPHAAYAQPSSERDQQPSTAPMRVASTSPSAAAQTALAPEAEAEGRMPGRAAASEEVSVSEGCGSLDPPSRMVTSASDDSAHRQSTLLQVAVLCWCHGVIGWGFFVLQAWTPMYLQSLGIVDLANAGLLASLPWLAAAFTGTVAGGLADRLVRSGRTTRLAVRRGMHVVSTLGCAAAVLPLAAAPGGSLPPMAATVCLVAAVGCYGFSFGGFHAYVQDVAAADAGQLLGLTNTASILGGIAGNLATGAVLQATGSYGIVFWVAAALYGTSWVCFQRLLKGEPISLTGLMGSNR